MDYFSGIEKTEAMQRDAEALAEYKFCSDYYLKPRNLAEAMRNLLGTEFDEKMISLISNQEWGKLRILILQSCKEYQVKSIFKELQENQ